MSEGKFDKNGKPAPEDHITVSWSNGRKKDYRYVYVTLVGHYLNHSNEWLAYGKARLGKIELPKKGYVETLSFPLSKVNR